MTLINATSTIYLKTSECVPLKAVDGYVSGTAFSRSNPTVDLYATRSPSCDFDGSERWDVSQTAPSIIVIVQAFESADSKNNHDGDHYTELFSGNKVMSVSISIRNLDFDWVKETEIARVVIDRSELNNKRYFIRTPTGNSLDLEITIPIKNDWLISLDKAVQTVTNEEDRIPLTNTYAVVVSYAIHDRKKNPTKDMFAMISITPFAVHEMMCNDKENSDQNVMDEVPEIAKELGIDDLFISYNKGAQEKILEEDTDDADVTDFEVLAKKSDVSLDTDIEAILASSSEPSNESNDNYEYDEC